MLATALKRPLCSLSARCTRCYASRSLPPHTVIAMPALSPTMTAGNIGMWQKKPGDATAPGDILVEIETDKAQMNLEANEEGVLARVLRESGDRDVPVGTPIAVMVDEGKDVSAFGSFSIGDAPASSSETASISIPECIPITNETISTDERLQPALDRMPKASAAAIRLALDRGVKITGLQGTGRGGQVTEADVSRASTEGVTASAANAAATYIDTPITSMRKVIASRLTQSVQQSPHYLISTSVSVRKLLKLRQVLNASANGRYKLTINDFLIKACAVACTKVPAVNSSWRDDVIRRFQSVDVSVGVATPAGLLTPILRSVEGLGLETISIRVKELAKRARDRKLRPEEFQGGTFTISNVGMNPAIERFSSIINPPQAAILAVGTTRKVVVPIQTTDGTQVGWDEQVVVTASFDHRVVDGVVGAEWMREFKDAVESPQHLLL
ncbi:hypothetical protein BO70DRAFT_338517 [Aspergillus heteromorphus CBS 117.55]|uniref:Acetyltransferase component of pyruvate dehydrogenase complex n=1 Tax=Aspergillus heteromorphus CBS 117.55 TaxID=1448321 RepID=A0A317W577_9EURO|nr:uncharacterized protein BO70DRAFT_338517 [Aspergillus heteromorphus CBS 117.55]PWY79290.1 hypothetical protein BO70DRAFT_338517 [Aspergillus heteromorphus CBS 117.55]